MLARRSMLPVLVAVAAIALPAPPASAASAKAGTKVVISLKLPAFHGKLRSSKRACVVRGKCRAGTSKRLVMP